MKPQLWQIFSHKLEQKMPIAKIELADVWISFLKVYYYNVFCIHANIIIILGRKMGHKVPRARIQMYIQHGCGAQNVRHFSI